MLKTQKIKEIKIIREATILSRIDYHQLFVFHAVAN